MFYSFPPYVIIEPATGKTTLGDDIVTNINCSLNCIYQEDGKCKLDNIIITSASGISECPYFREKSRHKKPYGYKSSNP